ncbi:MAG: PSD1 domain-containing protein [Phycisphaerales bacterium]|nr:PSD1 domain-containing protein [Phycisphaerales bacterium]
MLTPCGLAGAATGPAAPTTEQMWLFAGKLHPLVVHFPIALLLCAAALEFLRLRRGSNRPGPAGLACIVLGAFSALAAAAMGWSGAITAGHTGTTAGVLEWHRWLGVATVVFAGGALVLAILARVFNGPRLLSAYRLLLVAAALVVGVTGHFGASLIYGPMYIADSWASTIGASASPIEAPESGAVALVSATMPIDFTRDIQPLLARRCYGCHAGEKPEAGLNLTTREAALRGGKSGLPAIVPGKSGDSRLVRLITHQEPGKLMPPKGGALDEAQVALIRGWIDRGADWGDPSAAGEHWHWAYRAPARPGIPAVRRTEWPQNPIDYFVLARLENAGLGPSVEADKETLIRRVSLDLTGLPPTPAEIDDFLADNSPTAYEKVVERLLTSPRYGERWARPWLDLARYADTNGYEKDNRRSIWPYRDWVISALNRDLPFDQFTIQQLAGDLLPNVTLDQQVATGFCRNTMTNEEGGVDPEEFRVEAILDRVNTVSSVWLGSTVSCAQCHDHKFDPISQREYYQLFAFFNQDEPDFKNHQFGVDAAGPMVDATAPEDRRRLEDLRARAESTKRTIEERAGQLGDEQGRWEAEQAGLQPKWATLEPITVRSAAGATLEVGPGGVIRATGEDPASDTYTIEARTDLPVLTGLRLELLPDDSRPGGFVGRSGHGNIVLSRFEVAIISGPGREEMPISIATAVADHEQSAGSDDANAWLISYAVDGDPATGGWAIGPEYDKPHAAVVQFDKPAGAGPGAVLKVTLAQEYGGRHTISRLRILGTNGPSPAACAPLNPAVAAGLAVARDQRTPEQAGAIAAHYRRVAPALIPLRQELEETNRRIAGIATANTLVMRKQSESRETHVHIKGTFRNPGDAVRAGTPAALHKPATDLRPDRLGLAQWIMDPANPLTARVTVNRLWEQYFGRGIVETSDDFGTQGDAPSHPELLDWLATEFPRRGWSLKAMHRLIATSATYRQASGGEGVPLANSYERDPENRLLARGPRFRVEAEMVRDIALAASGLLSPKVGGPSVFPPQPPGTWTMIYSNDRWVESQGEDRHRRGLYTFWRRTSPYPTFATFDAPSREITCARRPRTTTPLQALTTMNDPAFVEAAAALARRMIDEAGPDSGSRLVLGFRLCTGRRPDAAELARLRMLIDQQLARYETDESAARSLSGAGTAGSGRAYGEAETAAWTVVANVLLNLDETLTKG